MSGILCPVEIVRGKLDWTGIFIMFLPVQVLPLCFCRAACLPMPALMPGPRCALLRPMQWPLKEQISASFSQLRVTRLAAKSHCPGCSSMVHASTACPAIKYN